MGNGGKMGDIYIFRNFPIIKIWRSQSRESGVREV